MINIIHNNTEIEQNGYTILPDIFSAQEINALIHLIESADTSGSTFRKSADLFAIRQFVKEIPETKQLIFNDTLKLIIDKFFGENYFLVKSIYFDKPETSNWFVAWHQDLTIAVDKKMIMNNFGPWTAKQNQFAVQPPLNFLTNIFTIRIHLDDTNKNNGALKVIPGSHQKGICRPETIDWTKETEDTCSVPKGGIMIMKPLLMHSSARSISNKRRRVIHLEFSNLELPEGLEWAEKECFFSNS